MAAMFQHLTPAVFLTQSPEPSPDPKAPESTKLSESIRTPLSTLGILAAQITELAASFTAALEDQNIPVPTFAADSPASYDGLTHDMFLVRQKLLDSLMDMFYLTQGPTESIFNFVHNCMPDVASLNILNHFDFWSAVPIGGSSTYAEIAVHTSLPEEVVRRILEHTTTLRIFAYTDPTNIAQSRIEHSSRSAAVAGSSGVRALISTLLDDAGPPMSILPQALDKYSLGKTALTRDTKETAFALWQSGELSRQYNNSWEYIENDGEGEKKGWRQRNFVEFMRYLKDMFQLESVVHGAYDWEGAGQSTVVDIGGSGGHDDVVLARRFPNLNITVQDLPEVEPAFNANVPEDVRDRVKFQSHDFFQPQTIQADIYLLKLILHDWPDVESVKILRGLIPALRPGARIIFIDYVGKQTNPSGEPLPRSIQQMGTSTDLRMLALFSAVERPVEAWKDIFKMADERFDVVRVDANPLSFIVVMEVIWQGEQEIKADEKKSA